MTISKDLFLAILSMDAYNRGYNQGVNLDGTKIGNAAIEIDSANLNEDPNDPNRVDEAAGFYAISYTIEGNGVDGLSSGDTVISFRGTDSLAHHPSTGLG